MRSHSYSSFLWFPWHSKTFVIDLVHMHLFFDHVYSVTESVLVNIEIPNMGDLNVFILINSIRKLQYVFGIAIPNNIQE